MQSHTCTTRAVRVGPGPASRSRPPLPTQLTARRRLASVNTRAARIQGRHHSDRVDVFPSCVPRICPISRVVRPAPGPSNSFVFGCAVKSKSFPCSLFGVKAWVRSSQVGPRLGWAVKTQTEVPLMAHAMGWIPGKKLRAPTTRTLDLLEPPTNP